MATEILSARAQNIGKGNCDRGYSLEWPHSRVVGVELHHDEPLGPDLLNITALRIVTVRDDAVPRPCALSQDVHVVAVEMDRVAIG